MLRLHHDRITLLTLMAVSLFALGVLLWPVALAGLDAVGLFIGVEKNALPSFTQSTLQP